MRLKRGIVGALAALGLGVTLGAQPFAPEIQLAINQLVTGVVPFTAFRTAASSYLNWGSTQGTTGYGLRDNGGAIEVKSSGGSWQPIPTSATLPLAAPYITRTLDGTLTNETALSTLATALIVNTTTTGVPVAYAGTTCAANQFTTAISATGVATCGAVPTSGLTGTVAVANGGTGLTSGTSGGVLAFTATGTLASSAALTQYALVVGGGAGAAPSSLGSLGTTTTVLHGNAVGVPTYGAVVLTTDVSGILPGANGGTANGFFAVTGPTTALRTFTFPNASATVLTSNTAVTAVQGGTGQSSYAVGDLLAANTTTTLSKIADVATGNVLLSGGVSMLPAYGKVGLTTHVTGTLGVANGGTDLTSYTVGDLLQASGATTLARLADVAVGSYLRSGGIGTAALWSTLVLPNAGSQGEIPVVSAANTVTMLGVGTAGQVLRSAGAAATVTWSTTIFPNAATTGDLPYASAANTYANLAAVATGSALVSAGVGTAPAWSATPRLTALGLGVAGPATGLHIDGAAAAIRLILDADNNIARIFSFRTNNTQRWALRVDGNETGANVGADFAVRRYDDAGAFIDAPITIERSTGILTLAAWLAPGWTTTATATGNTVYTARSTATNDDPTEILRQYRTTTIDGAATTLATIAVAATTTTQFDCRVTARRTGGAAGTAEDGAAYVLQAVYKNVAGTATEIAAETLTVIGEDQVAWTIAIAPIGGDAIVSVTGAANNNVTWHATCRSYAVSS